MRIWLENRGKTAIKNLTEHFFDFWQGGLAANHEDVVGVLPLAVEESLDLVCAGHDLVLFIFGFDVLDIFEELVE